MQRILLLGNVPCSDADLRELRLLSFYALNLRDVGRIENDRLLCSALLCSALLCSALRGGED